MTFPKRTKLAHFDMIRWQHYYAAAIGGYVAAGKTSTDFTSSGALLDDCAAIADAAVQGYIDRFTTALP